MQENRRVWVSALAAIGLVASVGLAAPPAMNHKTDLTIPAFLPVNASGQGQIPFSDLTGTRATAIVFVGTACPISNGYAPDYARLDKDLKAKGGRLVLVYSNPGDIAEADAHAARFGLSDVTRILDEDQSLMKRFGATMTPEAFVLDAKRVVRYCGSVDDKFVERGKARGKVQGKYLEEAAAQVLAGKFVLTPRTEAVGCTIETRKDVKLPGAPTYAGSVAQILNENCVACHRAGETGPMALDTFESAKRFADNIAGVTGRKQMPPWKPVAGHGDFKDARKLSDAQIKTLSDWASTGALPGDLTKAPKPKAYSSGWTLGKPDLIVSMPEEFNIPASGSDIYRCFPIPLPIDEDREVVAVEYRPGNRSVVHHVIGYLDSSGEGRKRDADEAGPGYTSFGGPGIPPSGELAGWVPGMTPQFLPDGVARRLTKGADLVMQVHYHPSGKPEKDKTQVGIYFGKKKAEKFLRILPVIQTRLEIPAGEANHEVKAAFPVPFDAQAIFVVPHMHLLGKTIQVEAKLPDGKSIPLIKIDDWDFNWQDMYTYKSPVKLPRGSVLSLKATYDNSEKNSRQPVSPPRTVTWGEETTDEMCLAFVGFIPDNESDPIVKMIDGMMKRGFKMNSRGAVK